MALGTIAVLAILQMAPVVSVSHQQINAQILNTHDCHLNKDVLQLNLILDSVKCHALCSSEPVCVSLRIEKERCFLYQAPNQQAVIYNGKYDDPCPQSKGYVSVFGPRFCYKMSMQKRNWQGALKECEKEGARLLVLSDDRIYNYIHTLLWDATVSVKFWVGMRKQQGERFKWIDGSSHVGKWQEGEPDYYSYQNCGILYVHHLVKNDGMSDVECSDVAKYICERQIPNDP